MFQDKLKFKGLLEKYKTFSTNKRNLKTLVTYIYKAASKISPEIVTSLFEFTNKNYDLRNASILKRKKFYSPYWK